MPSVSPSLVGRSSIGHITPCRDLPNLKTTAVAQKGNQVAQTVDEPRVAARDYAGGHEGKMATIRQPRAQHDGAVLGRHADSKARPHT